MWKTLSFWRSITLVSISVILYILAVLDFMNSENTKEFGLVIVLLLTLFYTIFIIWVVSKTKKDSVWWTTKKPTLEFTLIVLCGLLLIAVFFVKDSMLQDSIRLNFLALVSAYFSLRGFVIYFEIKRDRNGMISSN